MQIRDLCKLLGVAPSISAMDDLTLSVGLTLTPAQVGAGSAALLSRESFHLVNVIAGDSNYLIGR